MVYKYRVTLKGIKGFYRLYEVGGDVSLYNFHKQLRADLEFPQDQIIMFKALDAESFVVARYGLVDLGKGTVDSVTISDTVKAGVTFFEYFYDIPNRKSVNITLEGQEEVKGASTRLVLMDVKGPNPIEFENGYVAYEDLPDDQKHIHDRSLDPGPIKLAQALFGDAKDDEDYDDEEDEDDSPDDDRDADDGIEIYDGSEELTL